MSDVLKPDLTGEAWKKLTAAERIAKCHAFAREAAQFAQAAHPEMRQKYRVIAAQWNTLAAEIEDSEREGAPQPRA
jgi:hypothetical protein